MLVVRPGRDRRLIIARHSTSPSTTAWIAVVEGLPSKKPTANEEDVGRVEQDALLLGVAVPPQVGMLQVVPSSILSRAFCTPTRMFLKPAPPARSLSTSSI